MRPRSMFQPGLARWGPGLAVTLLGLPLPAMSETILVVGGPAELTRALEERGHRVVDGAPLASSADQRAQQKVARLRALADEGRRALYDEANLEVASSRLSEATSLVVEAGLQRFPLPELARLHLDLGVARLAAGALEDAAGEVAWALRLDPSLVLDPSAHGPPVRRLVERLRAERSGEGPARPVRLRSVPAGAVLRVDAGEIGVAPRTTEVPEGPHYVLATLPGRQPASVRIDVGPDGPANLRLLLPIREDPGEESARLLAERAGADLVVATGRADDGGWTARVFRPGRPATRVVAPNVVELAEAIGGGRDLPGRSASARRETGGGPPAWAWLAAGALLAAGVVIGAVALTSGSDDERMTLVAEFEGR